LAAAGFQPALCLQLAAMLGGQSCPVILPWGPLGDGFQPALAQSMQNSRLRDDPQNLCGSGLPTCAQVSKQNKVAAGAHP
jgi:hypothetical protein